LSHIVPGFYFGRRATRDFQQIWKRPSSESQLKRQMVISETTLLGKKDPPRLIDDIERTAISATSARAIIRCRAIDRRRFHATLSEVTFSSWFIARARA
jgi:hypothetical protein